MNRLLRLLLAAALLPALASPADSGIRTERRAGAFFLLPERNGVTPFVFVGVNEVTGRSVGGAIGRGICTGDIPRDCDMNHDRGFAFNFRAGDTFEIDPDLGAAHLEITRRGQTYEVTWTATGDPRPLDDPYECLGVPAGEVGVKRDASVAGRVFGRKVRAADNGGPNFLIAAAYGC